MHLQDKKYQFLNQKLNMPFYNLDKDNNLISYVVLMTLVNLMIFFILLLKMEKTKILL